MEEQIEVVIQESPGGLWHIWRDGLKMDEPFFRRAGDAQEYANDQGWVVAEVLKHNENC